MVSGQMEQYFTNLDFPEIRGWYPSKEATFWGPRSCEVAIIWPDSIHGTGWDWYIYLHCMNGWFLFGKLTGRYIYITRRDPMGYEIRNTLDLPPQPRMPVATKSLGLDSSGLLTKNAIILVVTFTGWGIDQIQVIRSNTLYIEINTKKTQLSIHIVTCNAA